jgi:hypothetical protein
MATVYRAGQDALLPWLRRAMIATALLLSSCTANQPKIVVDEAGLKNTTNSGSFAALNAKYEALRKATSEGKATLDNNTPIAAAAYDLVKAGTSVAYQQCSTFFKTAGTEQQYLLFSRDVIGVVGTIATGVLGATHASPAATAWLGLGSAAALSTISIYARNFLFSEDNVQAVQNLTLTAMSAATDAALSPKRNPYDFLTAVQAIMDVQSVCEVQNILSLVRQSLNAAQPTASPSFSGRITVSVPPQQVTLRRAAIEDVRLFADISRLRARVRQLSDAQILVLAQVIGPMVTANPSAVAVTLLQQYPGWQSRAGVARGVMLRILNSDTTGPLDAWGNALEVAERAPTR